MHGFEAIIANLGKIFFGVAMAPLYALLIMAGFDKHFNTTVLESTAGFFVHNLGVMAGAFLFFILLPAVAVTAAHWKRHEEKEFPATLMVRHS